MRYWIVYLLKARNMTIGAGAYWKIWHDKEVLKYFVSDGDTQRSYLTIEDAWSVFSQENWETGWLIDKVEE